MTTASALVPSPPQERTDFGVGASSAAAAIGVSDYDTPLDAWLVATGKVEPFAGNKQTRWGQILEPVIRANYIEKRGVTVYVPPVSLFHRELPFVRATPDGIVVGPENEWLFVGPQCKNVGLRQAPKWLDGVPTDYLIQGVVEMAVTDLPRIDFAVLIGAQDDREFTIWRDADLEADVLEQLGEFWKLVESNTQPAITESKKFRSHLLAQIKRKATVEASEATAKSIEKWRKVARAIKRLQRHEKQLKNVVLAELAAANANAMTSPLGRITVSGSRRKTAWKEVAMVLSAMPAALQRAEQDLISLRADLENEPGGAIYVHRIDGLRAQLRIAGGMHDFAALVSANTKVGEGSPRRPQNWTKDLGDDDDESED